MKNVKSYFIRIVIFIICVIEIYPLFWLLTASLKQQHEWTDKPAYALNAGFYIQNYIDAWTRGHMSTYFANSLINTPDFPGFYRILHGNGRLCSDKDGLEMEKTH